MGRYLDHNATTPLSAASRAAMQRFFDDDAPFGNASSIHARGRVARELVEEARRKVADAVHAEPGGVVFCATGSEAVALGIIGLARSSGRSDRTRVLVSPTEHPAALGAVDALRGDGFAVSMLAVDDAGRAVVPAAIDRDVGLVVVQLANHETGVVQPVTEIAALARDAGAPLFCDAVQAFGKLPIDVRTLGAAGIAVAAHKVYGPQGAAALVLHGAEVDALVPGGHQERGRRAGTEALHAIVGFGAAMDGLLDDRARQTALRERLDEGLAALGARIFGNAHDRLCNTTLCAFEGASGHLVAIALDLAGFEVSTGAACSSGSVKPSAVLLASGWPDEIARQAVRISLGRSTQKDDIDALLALLPSIVERVTRRGAPALPR